MYLIDSDTLALEWFSASRPPYAILSHTWGPEEVTFAEFKNPSKDEKTTGFQKIKSVCAQARQDGLGYVWVDTCCINKESSAELGEAINSMFRWYREAEMCYAYIEDLHGDIALPICDVSVLKSCRWFSRGWTLQELLAPSDIEFFGSKWNKIGRKQDLSEVLEQITGIPQKVLREECLLQDISVADRMSWAAGRQTSREEDIAYCLMGIFDVNMPMIYGEGRKAFLRLQDEIVKQTQDDTLFAWRASEDSASEFPYRGLFASSPDEFASEVSITAFRTSRAGSTTAVSGGRISLNCTKYWDDDGSVVLGLKCFRGTDLSRVVGIKVVGTGADNFLRAIPSEVILRRHKDDPIYEDVILERFAERKYPTPLDDIYKTGAVCLADLPQEISVFKTHSKRFQGSEKARMVPLVHLIEKKFAFELEVDRKASGVEQIEALGLGERFGIPKESRPHVLAVIWAELSLNSQLYEYHLSLEKLNGEKTAIEFLDARRAMDSINQHQVEVGWAIIDIKGNLQHVDGYVMFNIDLGFTKSDIVMAEVKCEQARQDQEHEKERLAQLDLRLKRNLLIIKIGPVALLLIVGGVVCLFLFGVRKMSDWRLLITLLVGIALCFAAVGIILFLLDKAKEVRAYSR